MSLKDRIEEDYKQAFKKGQTTVVSCLRVLKAAIKNAEIAAQHDFSDEETQTVVASELKKTKESLDAFEKGGRAEQAAVLRSQCDVLLAYMPEQLSADALDAVIQRIIQDMQAASSADVGKVMGAVMKEVKGKADGNAVRQRVQAVLTAKK